MRTLRCKSTSQKIKGEKDFIEESQKIKRKKENGYTFTFTPSQQHTPRPNPSLYLIIFILIHIFCGYFSIYLVKHFRFKLFLFLVKAHVNLGCGSRSLIFPHWSQHELSIRKKEEKYHVSCVHIQLIPTYS